MSWFASNPTSARLLRPSHAWGLLTAFAGGLGLASALASCAPVAQGGCDLDEQCGRGQMCDQDTNECVDKDIDTTSTESPAPATFSSKQVPFHRGKVCTVTEVKAGGDIPVTINPCYHPCLDKGAFKHKHYYECLGSRCNAWAVMFVEAKNTPTTCPTDAFGQFDMAECSWGPPVELKIGTTIDSGPVTGTMHLEIPFLTNADTAEIATHFDDTDFIQSKIDQYPPQDNRWVGGMDIAMNASAAEPPASCNESTDGMGTCKCFDVGF